MVDPEMLLDDRDLGVTHALGRRDPGAAVTQGEEVAHRHGPRYASGCDPAVTSCRGLQAVRLSSSTTTSSSMPFADGCADRATGRMAPESTGGSVMSKDDEEVLHRVHEAAHDQRNVLMVTWFQFQAVMRESRRLREEHQAARAAVRATIEEWRPRRLAEAARLAGL